MKERGKKWYELPTNDSSNSDIENRKLETYVRGTVEEKLSVYLLLRLTIPCTFANNMILKSRNLFDGGA